MIDLPYNMVYVASHFGFKAIFLNTVSFGEDSHIYALRRAN